MEEYLNIIYEYYPRDVFVSDLAYSDTPERTRFFELLEKLKASNQTFKEMCKSLSDGLKTSTLDYSFAGQDPCSTAIFHIPSIYHVARFQQCVVNISGLVKYYCIYMTNPSPRDNTFAKKIEDEDQLAFLRNVNSYIEEYYPDYKPFPEDWINKNVEHVYSLSVLKDYDNYATYFECLMSSNILY